MELTKDILLADNQSLKLEIAHKQGAVMYNEQLMKFMDHTEETPQENDMKKDSKKGGKGKPTKGGKGC